MPKLFGIHLGRSPFKSAQKKQGKKRKHRASGKREVAPWRPIVTKERERYRGKRRMI